MGGLEIFPPLYIYIKNTTMKIEKKIIKESLGDTSKSPKTFSTKKQNVIITEKQLEKLLEKLQK